MIQRLSDQKKPCAYCTQYGHTAWKCPRKPRSTLQTRNTLKTTKPMNRIGKVQKKTNAATAKWKKTQPANHQGYWVCHYCLKWTKEPVVEHMEAKTRRQDLRTVESNFTLSCESCNGLKLSKSHDEFCTRCD